MTTNDLSSGRKDPLGTKDGKCADFGGKVTVTQRLDHMCAVESPRHADRQAFTRELIQHHQ
jgi:hypothetical protein